MTHKYMEWDCPECGAPLILMAEYNISSRITSTKDLIDWTYENIELIRHCSNCLCDWRNEYVYEYGDETETQLERHFWG